MEPDVGNVVMTPRRVGNALSLMIVRKESVDSSQVFFEADGKHKGLFVNSEQNDAAQNGDTTPDMDLDFRCFLINQMTQGRTVENRKLKFWFVKNTDDFTKMNVAYEFFKELVRPGAFPRDYVGFIKKVMKLMQDPRYVRLSRCDVDLIPLEGDQQEAFVPEKEDTRPREEIVREQLLNTIEQAYPNILTMDDLVRILEVDAAVIHEQLQELVAKDIIQDINIEGKNMNGFRRNVILQKDEQVLDLQEGDTARQMSAKKPTIAIITNLLCEKQAVDAMMDDKTTFVRYKTEGESHVYTIGYIGNQKVVSTKLPMVGRELAAKISSGNTTTRLFGTFQDVDHVLIVGVAGSVPHIWEFEKHSRLGDIVVSSPRVGNDQREYLYVFCDKITQAAENQALTFTLKKWTPTDKALLNCADKVLERQAQSQNCPWARHIDNGLKALVQVADTFKRPSSDTDRLHMNVGDGQVLELRHPEAPEHLAHITAAGQSYARRGVIGSGRPVVSDPLLRENFAAQHELLAYDAEYDQVLDSIYGNRCPSFVFVRGVADYVDGAKGKEWQGYASLSAAAFAKSVILELEKEGKH